ncbi:hypothetical protein CONCODRAFT_2550 [Conidiobolus coronatus NRRL 28638]|uniref:BTB domain-containing protein n=1 Tax=Conidiobolus coronatus (strain ATCC 28846 / CBS 209.66 / NRRL 28638) TaxID=796925 RepID=A0A137PH99_CONC2|nr:hypothetical protein CONCODRAFT_2550 [Conidiobolus coronatus NRRL 28638]|eukprot:KXN74345.1 hypothetical protein CONCODRAFT_2550 [Conidiobolus coronatus NRRL 28638]
MKYLPIPVYLTINRKCHINFPYNLQGVDFCFYKYDDKKDSYKDAFIEIKFIEKINLAFISVRYDKEDISIIKNQLISKGSLIRFKIENNKNIEIGITNYEEWLSEQVILTSSSNFNEIIQSKTMAKASDIKLIVNSGKTKENIKCHSSHLCIKSPYFFNLLESGFKESESAEIDIHCSKEAFIPILQYIYTGEIDKKFFTKENYEIMLEMYFKVCKYQMEKVKDMVEVFILAFLDELNLKLLLQSTILNQDDLFSKTAIKFISNYF